MSERETIAFPRSRTADRSERSPATSAPFSTQTAFDRSELSAILDLYGRKVAAGEWRDYAIDLLREKAVFSVFRRASECPIYRIEKSPKLARRQGAYSIVTATGLILKRGRDLRRVLRALDTQRFEVVSP